MRHCFKYKASPILRKLFNPLPAAPPAFLELEYRYTGVNYKTGKTFHETVILLKKKKTIEAGIKPSSGSSGDTNGAPQMYPVALSDFERFYRKVRKWRLDLIPPAYEHSSHSDYSENWSETLLISYGKNDRPKDPEKIEVTNSRELGISGKDFQKLYLTVLLVKRLLKQD